MSRAGSAQPASPTMRAGTPATVLLCGTGDSTTEPAGDARAMADLDIAEDLRPRADQHAVADFGMAVAGLLAGAAEGDALQDRHVVLDHAVSPTTRPVAWSRNTPLPIRARGIDVDAERRRGAALQVEREIAPARLQQRMRQPVGLQRMKTLEIEQRLHHPQAGGIAVGDRHDVGAERVADRRIARDRRPRRPAGSARPARRDGPAARRRGG